MFLFLDLPVDPHACLQSSPLLPLIDLEVMRRLQGERVLSSNRSLTILESLTL